MNSSDEWEDNSVRQSDVTDVALSPKGNPAQTSLMKQVIWMFLNLPRGDWLTLDEVCGRLSKGTRQNVNRKTVATTLRRLVTITPNRILTREEADPDQAVFRLASEEAAIAYVHGRYRRAHRVTLTSATSEGAIEHLHRRTYYPTLSVEELAIAKSRGQYVPWGKNTEYYQVKVKGFTLQAWASGRGTLYIKEGWAEDALRLFGRAFVDNVEDLIRNRKGHVGVASPAPVPEEYRGHLPVGKRWIVDELDGRKSTIQYGYSQIKAGELDLHGPEDGDRGRRVKRWIQDDTEFKVDIANELLRIEKVLSDMPSQIARVFKEGVDSVLSAHSSVAQPDYQTEDPDREDISYV